LTIFWQSAMESCAYSSAVLMMSTLKGPLAMLPPPPPIDSLPPVLEPARGAVPPVWVALPPTPVPPVGSEPNPPVGVEPLPVFGVPAEPPLAGGISPDDPAIEPESELDVAVLALRVLASHCSLPSLQAAMTTLKPSAAPK
jgi:hypothetical protein